MKIKSISVLTLLLLSVFIITGLIPISAQDDTDFIARPFDQPVLDLSDDAVDSSWENVSYYKPISEFGTDGQVKFANNETHIFALFVIDATKEWGAVEFGAYAEFCMISGNDGWSFYINQDEGGGVTVYDDIYSGSAGAPDHDAVNDLSYEAVLQNEYYWIEIARPLNTGDDQDLAFADGDLWNLKFASSTNHAKGGLQNPTEFGPSEIYFLSVQLGGEVVIPDTPNRVDYDFWKAVIFVGIFIAAGLFITAHILVRQVYRPLKHPNAIVDSSFKKPTLKSRWEETFGDEDVQRKTKRSDLSDRKRGGEVEA